MNLTAQIAKQFRDANLGGNWTSVNLKDSLSGLTWQQATTQVYSFNTIAILVFHMNYYVGVTMKVLEGGPASSPRPRSRSSRTSRSTPACDDHPVATRP